MKKLLIVANWKSNKTIAEAHSFFISFLHDDLITSLRSNNEQQKTSKQIILCPSFTLLPDMSHMLSQISPSLPIFLGAQDVSPFGQGPHTGEESAEQLSEFVKYVIIGHSERREDFRENDKLLAQKVKAARLCGLEPIFCVQGKESVVPDDVSIIAYEPVDAISTGVVARSLDPEDAEAVATYIKSEHGTHYVLYGGSVTEENVYSYTSQPSINGVLVGGASLDPTVFSQIIQLA